MIEIDAFCKNLRAWLMAVAGCGDRVYNGIPQTPPVYPSITFRMRRTPSGDYPAHGWDATVSIELHDPKKDTLSAIEQLIYDDIASGGESGEDTIEAKLSSADVIVPAFHLAEVGEDQESFSFEDDRYVATTRVVSFAAVIVGQ